MMIIPDVENGRPLWVRKASPQLTVGEIFQILLGIYSFIPFFHICVWKGFQNISRRQISDIIDFKVGIIFFIRISYGSYIFVRPMIM